MRGSYKQTDRAREKTEGGSLGHASITLKASSKHWRRVISISLPRSAYIQKEDRTFTNSIEIEEAKNVSIGRVEGTAGSTNVVRTFVVDLTITINVRFPDHLINLGIREFLA